MFSPRKSSFPGRNTNNMWASFDFWKRINEKTTCISSGTCLHPASNSLCALCCRTQPLPKEKLRQRGWCQQKERSFFLCDAYYKLMGLVTGCHGGQHYDWVHKGFLQTYGEFQQDNLAQWSGFNFCLRKPLKYQLPKAEPIKYVTLGTCVSLGPNICSAVRSSTLRCANRDCHLLPSMARKDCGLMR